MIRRKIKQPKCIEYGPVNSTFGYANTRWVENVSCGLRRVGFCDEIMRKEGRYRSIDHHGWFNQDDGEGEVFRGVVYQLPARNGMVQYVYGYDDPHNDDCAFLCFDVSREIDGHEALVRAARAADRFAEIWAEHERDYHRAWDAGRRYAELGDEVKTIRQETLELCAEMRAARQCLTGKTFIRASLRVRIVENYQAIQRMYKQRAELADNYGREDAFKEMANG